MFKFIYTPPDLQSIFSKGPQSIEPEFVLPLKHYRQKFNWDCGVSCVIMALQQQTRQHFLENFTAVCKEEGFNNNTWTIDLCYLLKRYNVRHLYCTSYLGVRDEIKELKYYSATFDADRERVVELFQRAHGFGIPVKKYSLTTHEMVYHLFANGPIIALVDANLLRCRCCAFKTLLAKTIRLCLPGQTSYQGHYVVVCGYSLAGKTLCYRNPARRNRVCTVTFEAFDAARKCLGTDEDAILIFN